MATTRGKTKQIDAGNENCDDIKAEIASKSISLISIFQKLAYFNKNTNQVIEQNEKEKINRQYSLLNSKIAEAYDLIQNLEELKLELDVETDEVIEAWSNETKEQLKPFETAIRELESKIKDENSKVKEKEMLDKIEYETKIREKIRKEEEQAENEKHARKEKFALELEAKQLEIAAQKRIQTKLPDLHITKFQGTHLDWVRFWNMFLTQTDQATISDESKFSYLKELVIPRVRLTIEKLPVSSEGYKRAKIMLEHGDPAEVVNAHIKQIHSLPVQNGISKQKVHEFHDQLLCHVQALDTLGKLQDVTGNVRMTLDKLEGIRADLTRTDPEWKKWDFNQLLEALIDQNPIQHGERESRPPGSNWKRETALSTRENSKAKSCVYCEKGDHK